MAEPARLAALPGPIAYLTGEYPRATDTFIQREVAALRALGITVHTCSVRRTDAAHHVGPEQKAEAAATFNVIRAARRPLGLLAAQAAALARSPGRYLGALRLALTTGAPGLKGLAWQLFYFAEAGVLARHLRALGVCHLHNHFGNSSCSVAMLTSALSGIPYSYTMHGPAIFFAPERWRIDVKIARAAFVSCISHFSRSQGMIFAAPEHWPKMHIVHCGVDPAVYDRPAVPATAGGGPRLLFVGRLAAVKGLPMLLDAAAALAPAHPGLRLTIVGDGPDRAWLEARAAALGIGAQVVFTGYRSQAEVADALTEADVFVLPSFAEGVPVVLMEAMAARVPVVATRVAGVAELVEDGVSGHLVPPGDAEALAGALGRIMGDAALRRAMGAAGRARVVEAFDARREASRLAGLLAAHHASAPRPPLRPPETTARPGG